MFKSVFNGLQKVLCVVLLPIFIIVWLFKVILESIKTMREIQLEGGWPTKETFKSIRDKCWSEVMAF